MCSKGIQGRGKTETCFLAFFGVAHMYSSRMKLVLKAVGTSDVMNVQNSWHVATKGMSWLFGGLSSGAVMCV